MDVDKTMLNAKSLPDNVDKNLSSDDVISSYSALKRSTYREIQRRRAKRKGRVLKAMYGNFQISEAKTPTVRKKCYLGLQEVIPKS